MISLAIRSIFLFAVLLPANAWSQAHDTGVKLILGGDTMVGRYMGRNLRLHGGEDPFKDIGHLLARAPLSIINLETPVTDTPPLRIRRGGKFKDYSTTFRMPTRYLKLLTRHGIDAVVLANNHAEDCDDAGTTSTLKALDTAGIKHVGIDPVGDATKDLRFKSGETMVTVLAVAVYRNRGFPRPNQKIPVNYMRTRHAYPWMAKRVRELRAERPNDLIIASLHWGKQYLTALQPGQVTVGKSIIDAGADIVFGHHPHFLRAVEPYKDGIILYSTGNLVFDMLRRLGRRSAVFELDFRRLANGRLQAREMKAHAIALRGLKKGPREATPAEAKSYLAPLLDRAKYVKVGQFTREGTALVWRRSAE